MEHDQNMPRRPQVLAFDVFGTVVDWYSTVRREVEALGRGLDADAVASAWRAGYPVAMERVRSGELGWTRIDDLHRMILDDVLEKADCALDEATRVELNRVWHRLDPWPDSPGGLARLRRGFHICTLSNGNLSLLAEMAKHASLPWDLILSAENFRHYKPDPQTYLGVADVFDVDPAQVMMVAAHKNDLASARACGLMTAFIRRPAEFGPNRPNDTSDDPVADFNADDIHQLATMLGC
ncbi:MAG: haloacid dehalogenase type II [Burkholderiaceae bacterium]|nr:haloacid dehalogenase type II [Burkholderiaceae bacterium]